MPRLKYLYIWGPALVFFSAALWATDAPFRAHLTQGLASNFIVFGEHAVSCLVAIPILLYNWGEIGQIEQK